MYEKPVGVNTKSTFGKDTLMQTAQPLAVAIQAEVVDLPWRNFKKEYNCAAGKALPGKPPVEGVT